jgi:ABC-type transport system involved in cytochrome bd biosynthesis fused ATPase/permease subunit
VSGVGVSQFLQANPRLAIISAGIVLLGSVCFTAWFVLTSLFPPEPPRRLSMAYFYDLNTAELFEAPADLTGPLRANIAFARSDATDEEVLRASELAGAHDFVQHLPEGYGTVLGERGYSLSGGQRQRIAIARAILADPAVLILDDATSAVDATKEHEIRSALATLMEGRTTLVIAHRAATIALADRVAVLEGGRIVETGAHDELLRESPRYRRLLALDLEGVA